MLVEGDSVKEMTEDKLHSDMEGYEYVIEQDYDFLKNNEEITSSDYSDVEIEDSLHKKATAEVEGVVLMEVSVSNTTQTEIDGDFPERYTEYMTLALEERVKLHGHLEQKTDVDVFDIVRKNFDKIGYSVGFDDIYSEATAIEKYISKKKCVSRAEVITEKLKGYGSYENIPSSVKADVFGFEIDDSGVNLKLYMQVVKALGLQMVMLESN